MEAKNRTVALELGTSNGDIYTVPDNYEAEVYSIFISNASSSNVTISLDWYDSKAPNCVQTCPPSDPQSAQNPLTCLPGPLSDAGWKKFATCSLLEVPRDPSM